jgi:hypothetical protein
VTPLSTDSRPSLNESKSMNSPPYMYRDDMEGGDACFKNIFKSIISMLLSLSSQSSRSFLILGSLYSLASSTKSFVPGFEKSRINSNDLSIVSNLESKHQNLEVATMELSLLIEFI